MTSQFWSAVKQGVDAKLAFEGVDSGELAFAVKKGSSNPELLAKFNDGLKKKKIMVNLIKS